MSVETVVTLVGIILVLIALSLLAGVLIAIPGTELWHEAKARRDRRRRAAEMRQRIATGALLNVYKDRFSLLRPQPLVTTDDRWMLIKLREEVEDWCNEHAPSWSYVDADLPEMGPGVIVFDRPEDAVAFKMRWY